uniref:Retrotransposon gag domain-containing protein n=1 Tax=Nicotiana tabacum TaxID=4097 RepID=A0A1S3ZAZ2_TOBAC|nr:PREDICTED: uncharacterized protein LOC107784869 [Nicotiana tabacum]
MSSEGHLPTIPILEDSPLSFIPTSESVAAEENRALRLRIASGNSNVPIRYPNTPLGYPTISAHFAGTPSKGHPQVISGVGTNIFTAPPTSTTAQPTLSRPSFDTSSFTFQVPSFPPDPTHFATNSYPQQPWYEFIVGQEKATKNPEQEEITRKMRSMEQSLKNIQGLKGQKSVSYADLCMFPHVHLPLGFKTPKFEKYDGHGDPIAHLKRYSNQLRGAGGKKELLMAYFGESLVGIASEWQFQYNIDIAPDSNSLSNLKKKSSESFREYAVKWREQAARIKPPMDETEMVSIFLQAQVADYFQNMMSTMGKSFVEAIKIGEMVENGLKIGHILSQSSIRVMSQAIQSGSGGVENKKKKEEVAIEASSLRNPHPPRGHFHPSTPQHYYPHRDVAYAMFPQPPNGFVATRTPNRQNPESPSYRLSTRCAYHSGVEGHDTEDCWTLKRAIENLIEQQRVVLKDKEIPDVTNNPLPAHNNGPVIGMICEDNEFDPALKASLPSPMWKGSQRLPQSKIRGRRRVISLLEVKKRLWKPKQGQYPLKTPFFMFPELTGKNNWR